MPHRPLPLVASALLLVAAGLPALAAPAAGPRVSLSVPSFAGTSVVAGIGDAVPLVARAGGLGAGMAIVLEDVSRGSRAVQTCMGTTTCTRTTRFH